MKNLFIKYKELISYVFFGALTTVVSVGSFKIFDSFLGERYYLLTNVISWIIAVVFAFFTNKMWVFASKTWKAKTVVKEAFSFAAARLFSLGVEELGLWLLVSVIGMKTIRFTAFGFNINGNFIAKIIMQFVVVVLNYVFSKFVVFRKKKKENLSDDGLT